MPTAYPVVAPACSEANYFWNFSLGVASCAVSVLWATDNWPILEILWNITQQPPVSLLPPAVSNLKNETKNICSQVQVDFFSSAFFSENAYSQFMGGKKKSHIHHLKLCREGNSYSNKTKLPGKPLTVVSIRK